MDRLIIEKIIKECDYPILSFRRVSKLWRDVIDEKCDIKLINFDETKVLPFKNIHVFNVSIKKLFQLKNASYVVKRLYIRHQEIEPRLIHHLKNIESLVIENCYYRESLDISPFQYLRELKCDSLLYNDGEVETSLSNLKTLSVDCELNSANIKYLSKLENLKCLCISGKEKLSSLNSLTISRNSDDFLNNNNIQKLVLYRYNDEIKIPENVIHLEIYSSSKPNAIDLKNLKTIILFNTSINDISHLINLEVIETYHPLSNLNVWRCKNLKYLKAPSMKGLNLPNGQFNIDIGQKIIKVFKTTF